MATPFAQREQKDTFVILIYKCNGALDVSNYYITQTNYYIQ